MSENNPISSSYEQKLTATIPECWQPQSTLLVKLDIKLSKFDKLLMSEGCNAMMRRANEQDSENVQFLISSFELLSTPALADVANAAVRVLAERLGRQVQERTEVFSGEARVSHGEPTT